MLELYIINDISDFKDSSYHKLFSILSSHKKEQLSKMVHKKEKIQSLLGELLLLYSISDKYNVKMSEIVIEYSNLGQPIIIFPPKIFCSITHIDNIVVCAISDFIIGIDVEKESNFNKSLASRIFHLDEYNFLMKSSLDVNVDFIKIWTAKESYSKARGLGLNLDFSSFSVINRDRFGKIINTNVRAKYTHFYLKDNYILCLLVLNDS